MATKRKTPFASIHATYPARDALQRVNLELSAQKGQRLTTSRVLLAVLAVARRHDDELSDLINPETTDEELLTLALGTTQEGEDQ